MESPPQTQVGKIKFDPNSLKENEAVNKEYKRKLTPKEEIEELRKNANLVNEDDDFKNDSPKEDEMKHSVERVKLRTVNSVKNKIGEQIKFGGKPVNSKKLFDDERESEGLDFLPNDNSKEEESNMRESATIGNYSIQ